MPLTEEEENQFKECFEMFDELGEGVVAVSELSKMMTLLGWDPTQADLNDVIKKSGLKSSGKMNKDQYLKLMVNWVKDHKVKHSEAELREAFAVFDKDGSGYIEWEELKYVMQGTGEPLTDEEVTAMMTEADKDGDGRIDYEEFVEMMQGDNIHI